jgi:hypothetical protein
MTTYSFQARPDGAVRLVIADRELPKPTDGFEERERQFRLNLADPNSLALAWTLARYGVGPLA